MERIRCEWDPVKDRINRRKHGVSFGEAEQLFASDLAVREAYDKEHSDDEDRFMALGPIRSGLVVVAYTEKDDGVIRIISARRATRREARMYRTWARSRCE